MSYIEPLKSKNPNIGTKFRAVRERGGPKGPSLPTEAEARRWAVAKGWMPPPVTKLTDLVQEYINARLADEHPITVEFSRGLLATLTSLFHRRGWTTVADLNLTAVDHWRTQTKGKGVTRPLAYLLAVLRWGVYHRDIVVDPKVLEIKRKRQRSQIAARVLLTDAQVRAAVKRASLYGPHAHALIHYLATYGARPITACRLRVGDFHPRTGELVVDAKHSGTWRHPLRKDTIRLFAMCAADRGPKEPLFLAPVEKLKADEGGRPMLPAPDGGWAVTQQGEAESLARWYHRCIGKAVLPEALWRIYHLKRYAITSMLDSGMNPKQIAEFTGHLDVGQILTYARTSAAKAEASVAMLPKATARGG